MARDVVIQSQSGGISTLEAEVGIKYSEHPNGPDAMPADTKLAILHIETTVRTIVRGGL